MNVITNGRTALMSLLTLAAPSLAIAQGVSNGTFATPQTELQSPWFQFYPSGILDPVEDTGVRMEGGFLLLEPRPERNSDEACPQAADIAVLQYGINPIGNAKHKSFVELEFDMNIILAAPYTCPGDPPIKFGVRKDPNLPAFRARVWEGRVGQPVSTYQSLGDFVAVSTVDANSGWLHYRATWERISTGDDARYAVTLELGDIGESYPSDDGMYLRPNQAKVEIDNVQLKARCSSAEACVVRPPLISMDLIQSGQTSPRRPVEGGQFSGTGPNAVCEETGASNCPDLNGDGQVSGMELGAVLSAWNSTDRATDLDDDGVVGGGDLGIVLAFWGPCGTPCE